MSSYFTGASWRYEFQYKLRRYTAAGFRTKKDARREILSRLALSFEKVDQALGPSQL